MPQPSGNKGECAIADGGSELLEHGLFAIVVRLGPAIPPERTLHENVDVGEKVAVQIGDGHEAPVVIGPPLGRAASEGLDSRPMRLKDLFNDTLVSLVRAQSALTVEAS